MSLASGMEEAVGFAPPAKPPVHEATRATPSPMIHHFRSSWLRNLGNFVFAPSRPWPVAR